MNADDRRCRKDGCENPRVADEAAQARLARLCEMTRDRKSNGEMPSAW
ncbi:MAG TPA: hypothetical protein VLM89_03300 [Phycisphaerae bacterium]|nr:hypothetical protein [Phycisphaerae bacterium]